jgi:small-conductance mechanosensitive channel
MDNDRNAIKRWPRAQNSRRPQRTPRFRRERRLGVAAYHASASARLRKYRQGTLLAVAITGMVLMLWGVPAVAPAQEPTPSPTAAQQNAGAPIGTGAIGLDSASAAAMREAADSAHADSIARDPARSVAEATGTVRQLMVRFTGMLPKILFALVLVVLAALLVRAVRFVLRRLLGRWERADAVTAMAGVVIWLLAIGVALSVVMGDARALVGSVGLLGLALSWALQSPIESFAGWLLNSFKGYYRIGDRIAVGDVFGDVYRVDVLNTTVWEAGGPDKSVQGAQPTGALITFPNSEVLRSNITNYTRQFPYVWDEVAIGVANESDIPYAVEVVAQTARRIVGEHMRAPIERYRSLLVGEGLAYDVADEPQVYVSATDSWTNLTVRYLVGARERRAWSSRLTLEINAEIGKDEHAGRILPSYPVRRIYDG